MKNKTKKILKIVLKILLIIMIPIGVFYGTYEYSMYKSYSSYKTILTSYLNKINKINKTITMCENKDKSINIDKSKTNLPAKVGSLMKIKQNLSTINPTDKYNKINENVILGLEYNIDLYKAILSSINNNDSGNSIDSIKKYKASCLKYYGAVILSDVDLTLPTETSIYIDNFIKYEGNQIKVSSEQKSKMAGNMDYINSIENIINKYLSFKTDFISQISSVRNGEGTFDIMLSKIAQNLSLYNDVNNDFSKIKLDFNNAQAVNSYRALKKVLSDYSLYLDSTRSSISNEESLSATEQPSAETLNTIYSVPIANFTNVNTDYEEFSKSFSDFKSSNIDNSKK